MHLRTSSYLSQAPLREALEAGGATVTFVDARRVRELRRWIETVRKIAAIARQERAEIVFGWMSKGHLYGGIAGLLVNSPAIYYQHALPEAGLIAGFAACSRQPVRLTVPTL